MIMANCLEMTFRNSSLSFPTFPDSSVYKESACKAGNTRDASSIPGSGISSGEWNGDSLQHSCLENPMDRGAWWATVHRVGKS